MSQSWREGGGGGGGGGRVVEKESVDCRGVVKSQGLSTQRLSVELRYIYDDYNVRYKPVLNASETFVGAGNERTLWQLLRKQKNTISTFSDQTRLKV